MTEEDQFQKKGPGRPTSQPEGPEPGRSYVDALRKWPDEYANIKRAELANRMDAKDSTVASYLQNSMRPLNPTQTRLDWSLRIIKACGGTEADLANWTAYHYAVAKFQRMGSKGDPPRPPRPGDVAVESSAHEVELPRESTPRRKRLVVAAGLVLATLLAAAVWAKLPSNASPAARVTVVSNPDDLVVPTKLRDSMGNYVTTLPINEVPAPPRTLDQCAGRYEWAHSAPINGMDVGSSIAKIDITALDSDLTIDRVNIHID